MSASILTNTPQQSQEESSGIALWSCYHTTLHEKEDHDEETAYTRIHCQPFWLPWHAKNTMSPNNLTFWLFHFIQPPKRRRLCLWQYYGRQAVHCISLSFVVSSSLHKCPSIRATHFALPACIFTWQCVWREQTVRATMRAIGLSQIYWRDPTMRATGLSQIYWRDPAVRATGLSQVYWRDPTVRATGLSQIYSLLHENYTPSCITKVLGKTTTGNLIGRHVIVHMNLGLVILVVKITAGLSFMQKRTDIPPYIDLNINPHSFTNTPKWFIFHV